MVITFDPTSRGTSSPLVYEFVPFLMDKRSSPSSFNVAVTVVAATVVATEAV